MVDLYRARLLISLQTDALPRFAALFQKVLILIEFFKMLPKLVRELGDTEILSVGRSLDSRCRRNLCALMHDNR